MASCVITRTVSDKLDKAYKPFFWAMVLPVFWVCAIAFPAYLIYGLPVGGLTRIGFWPERDYLQTRIQMPIKLAKNAHNMPHSDGLVIGDSFAFANAWQSVVTEKTGLVLQTYGYPNNKDCFVDFLQAKTKEPATQKKWVIVESVERAFLSRMMVLQRCDAGTSYPLIPAAEGVLWQTETTSSFHDVDLMRQLQTVIHQAELSMNSEKKWGDAARNVALKDTHYFSNQRSDRLLYLDHDENRIDWTAQQIDLAVQNLKQVQDDLAGRGYQLMILIVPDKLHVYEDMLRISTTSSNVSAASTDVTARLRAAGVNALDVLHPLRLAASQEQDVYLPNDTHTSAAGYRVIGNVVAQSFVGH